MEYGDEATIRHRLEASEKKSHSIYNNLEIDGVRYVFEKREFEYGFSMVVPTSFEYMTPEVARRKFPSEERPKVVISSDDSRICIALNSSQTSHEDMDDRVTSMREYIKRVAPANVFFIQGVYELPNKIKVGHFDYRYPAIDNDIYNITFCADLPGLELLGWFICPVQIKEKWEPLFRQIMQSIELTTQGG